MRYELGDKVAITKYWDKVPIKEMATKATSLYDEEDDANVQVDRIIKKDCREIGYVCGVRNIVDTVEYGTEAASNEFDTHLFDEVHWIYGTETKKQVYVVATNMSGLRRVSFEDIKFIG